MKQLTRTEQHAIITIATARNGVRFQTTGIIAQIIFWFLCSVSAQLVAVLIYRSAEFAAFQVQALAADWQAGIGLIVCLIWMVLGWLMLPRPPYIGG
jgi:uncharacterized YccA/Bax inhibitor family protein